MAFKATFTCITSVQIWVYPVTALHELSVLSPFKPYVGHPFFPRASCPPWSPTPFPSSSSMPCIYRLGGILARKLKFKYCRNFFKTCDNWYWYFEVGCIFVIFVETSLLPRWYYAFVLQILEMVLRCGRQLLHVTYSFSSVRCIRRPGFHPIKVSCYCVIDVVLIRTRIMSVQRAFICFY